MYFSITDTVLSYHPPSCYQLSPLRACPSSAAGLPLISVNFLAIAGWVRDVIRRSTTCDISCNLETWRLDAVIFTSSGNLIGGGRRRAICGRKNNTKPVSCWGLQRGVSLYKLPKQGAWGLKFADVFCSIICTRNSRNSTPRWCRAVI